jgi:hypothetical protein
MLIQILCVCVVYMRVEVSQQKTSNGRRTKKNRNNKNNNKDLLKV